MRKFGKRKIRDILVKRLDDIKKEVETVGKLKRRQKCEYVKQYQREKKERRVYSINRIRRIDDSIL